MLTVAGGKVDYPRLVCVSILMYKCSTKDLMTITGPQLMFVKSVPEILQFNLWQVAVEEVAIWAQTKNGYST